MSQLTHTIAAPDDQAPVIWRTHGAIAGTKARKTIALDVNGRQVASVDIPVEIAGPFAVEIRLWEPKDGRRGVVMMLTAEANAKATLLQMGMGSVTLEPGHPLDLTLRPALADLGETITFGSILQEAH